MINYISFGTIKAEKQKQSTRFKQEQEKESGRNEMPIHTEVLTPSAESQW